MTDGAHLGLPAERSLQTILGDTPPPDETGEETMSPVAMRAYLELPDQPLDYGEAARRAGRTVLAAFLAAPDAAQMDEDELYLALRRRDDPSDPLAELTGFMWGWAVNAARYCVELPPAPNPAIIEL